MHKLKFHKEYSVFCCVLTVPNACSKGVCRGTETSRQAMTMYHTMHLCQHKTMRHMGHTGVGLDLLCRREACRLPDLQLSSHERFLSAGFDVLGARC